MEVAGNWRYFINCCEPILASFASHYYDPNVSAYAISNPSSSDIAG
ncbi:unnamed protein product [marine sediment metagenome]|uniref:Uncharacterized protein n=1 Tax=marine sediment metagenome TaxID=412755 RepID=X1PDM9_9ZZZZ